MERIKVVVWARNPLHQAYLLEVMATIPMVEIISPQQADEDTAVVVEKQILTEGEKRVLRAFCHCEGVKVVAAKLGISPATVKKHLEHIYSKLGVSSLHRALITALQMGLI